MSDWSNIPENIEDYLGFVYIIYHKENYKYYIGKKQFWRNIRRKPLKGKKRVRLDRVESDWKKYWGSSKPFQEYVKEEGEDKFERRILYHCRDKWEMSYMELKEQLFLDVLNDEKSFNGIINVRLKKRKHLNNGTQKVYIWQKMDWNI